MNFAESLPVVGQEYEVGLVYADIYYRWKIPSKLPVPSGDMVQGDMVLKFTLKKYDKTI